MRYRPPALGCAASFAGTGRVLRTIRIGSGAGYSGDRIEPAVELAEKGDIQYLVFECLGERTVALAQQARMKNPDSGYDPLLEERMRAVLPACAAKGIRIVTNMGAANPVAAARKTAEIAKIARAFVAEDRRRRRRRRARCLQGRRPCDHGIRRHDQTARQPAVVGQCLSRRRADGGGADRRRRYRDHRACFRSRAVSGADDSRLRLGDGRLEPAGAGHRRRASARMRRPDHRRLLRRSRLQGCSRSGAARLSHRRSRRGRQPRDHQGRRLRRRGDGADLQGATALRGARSHAVYSAGRGRGFFASEGRGDRDTIACASAADAAPSAPAR